MLVRSFLRSHLMGKKLSDVLTSFLFHFVACAFPDFPHYTRPTVSHDRMNFYAINAPTAEKNDTFVQVSAACCLLVMERFRLIHSVNIHSLPDPFPFQNVTSGSSAPIISRSTSRRICKRSRKRRRPDEPTPPTAWPDHRWPPREE